jgi:tetratricopeptide (TPR) repeat protein
MVKKIGWLLLLAPLAFAACTTTPNNGDEINSGAPVGVDPKDIQPLPPSERDENLNKATSFIKGGKIGQALEILYDLADRDPKDHQTLYILGRTLYDQQSFRASRNELKKVVKLNPQHSLAWQKLGDIYQRLGEHPEAIAAYTQVAALVPNTIDPLRRIAANYLIRGEPQRGISALERARARLAESNREDVLLEYLTAKIQEEIGNQRQTAIAARAFLRLSKSNPSYKNERLYYMRWLKVSKIELPDKDIASLMGYARSTLSQVIEGEGRPDLIAKKASKRLYAYDKTTLFVTIFPAKGLGVRLVGRGQRKNLLSSLSRALDVIMTSPGYSKKLCKRAAIRISIVSGDFEDGEVRPLLTRPTKKTKPNYFDLGRHGVAFDAGDIQPFALPGDATTENLQSVEDMLRYASRKARLSPKAWAQRRLLRFRTSDHVQPTPGARVFSLEDGEPMPRPVPEAASLWEVAQGSGDWLLRSQQSNGSLGQVYLPHSDLFFTPKASKLELIQFEDMVTIPIQAATRVTTTGGFEFRKNRLYVALKKLDKATLKKRLDSYFSFDEKITTLGEGAINESLSYRVKGVKAQRIRILLEAAAGQYDIAAHARAVTALATLHKKCSRLVYLDGALLGARWAQRRLSTLEQRSLTPYLVSSLEMFNAVDTSLASENRDKEFQKIQKTLARLTLAQLSKSIGGSDSTSTTKAFQVSQALIALSQYAFQTKDDKVLDQVRTHAKAHIKTWQKAIRIGRQPLDPDFARALVILFQQYRDNELRDFALKIGAAIASKMHDPATKQRSAGGIALSGDYPTGSETAHGNKGLIALTQLCAMNRGDKKLTGLEAQYRVACMSAAAFQLRHLLRAEHSYFLPNIRQAAGSFRIGLYKCEVTLDSMQLNITSLLDVVTIMRKAGSSGG